MNTDAHESPDDRTLRIHENLPLNPDHQRSAYLGTASALRRRLAWVRFASRVRRSHLLAALLAAGAVLALRLFAEWRANEWLVAGGLLALWLVLVALLSAIRLPRPAAALRTLDRLGSWKDCFSSAWEFLHRPDPSEAEKLHLSRAAERLAEARRSVPAILPAAPLRTAWIAPALALAFAFASWGRIPPDARDLALTQEMKDAAALQAEDLKREAERVRDLASLTEEEREELEALRAEVDSVAEALANPDDLTAGEMLESLEGRARAAERLAEKLGAFSDEWASPEMLAEMARHPDTADLSLLIGDKAAEGAAAEAGRLGTALAEEDITAETQERFTRSVESIAGAAVEKDRERPVGERFGNASRKLLEAQPKTAAREFEELAKHFRELAAREEAKAKLDELAKNLREAGAEIGGSELKKMESIAESSSSGGQGAPQGLQAIDADTPGANPAGQSGQVLSIGTEQGDPSATPTLAQAPAQQPGTAPAPVPGTAPGEGEGGGDGEKKGEQTFSAPVPGEKAPEGQSGSGIGMSDQSRDGKGKGGMLSAPIPGMDPGEGAPGAGLSLGSAASSQSGQGGNQVGTGTAALTDANSETLKATGDSEVVAQTGREGDSTVRAIEGQVRAEAATRTRQEMATEFIAVEEQALDEQALPLSRRRQVLKYFSGVRAQFEKGDGE